MRVVLLTRTGRPSGVCMAQALRAGGVALVGIIAERRSGMVMGGGRGFFPLARELIRKHGLRHLTQKVWEAMGTVARGSAGSIRQFAAGENIPFFLVDNHNDATTRSHLQNLRPDILALCNTRKIAPQVFAMAPRGALNLHSSLLPRYAGLDSVFWALYHRERAVGFSIHRVAEQLDAGKVLYQETIACEGIPRPEALQREIRQRGCQAMARVILDLDAFEAGVSPSWPVISAKVEYFSWPTARQRRWYAHFQTELAQTQPLKILHLITRMVRGGAQENTLATVEGLRLRGHNVVLATGPSEGPEGSMEEEIQSSGIPCRKFPWLTRRVSPWNDLLTLISLTRWMRREKLLIVHTHTSKAGVLGRIAARLARVPVIVHTPHGHVFGGYFSAVLTRMFLGIERWLVCKTDKIVALTVQEKKEHLERGVGREGQFAVIPSGVRVRDFNPEEGLRGREVRKRYGIAERATVIGTVARLVPVKGVEHLLNAFRMLLDSRPDSICLIVGDGPERKRLESLAAQKGMAAPKMIFAGYRKDVPEVLAAMDVFAMPSLNEGMGRAIVQAGLMAKPIVASAVSGIRDLIRDGENGLLVPPADAKSLAKAIERLLKDKALSEKLGRNARAHFLRGFSEERMVEDIASLYGDLLQEKGIPKKWLQGVPQGSQETPAWASLARSTHGSSHDQLSR